MPSEKSVGIILFSVKGAKPEFLILHYRAGHWSLPKGHAEKGEGERQTALRELKEETGISGGQIEFAEGFREGITYSFKKGDATVHKTAVFFLGRLKNPSDAANVKLSSEHQGFEWLPLRQAEKRLTYQTDREVVGKAADAIEGATFS
ncbi:NUDIX domain-containing protein [Candidatus Micrarchaeota archaeon]|nr:NUDIX domain-containing protein [Candidatus Micrarchaeota archaeon]